MPFGVYVFQNAYYITVCISLHQGNSIYMICLEIKCNLWNETRNTTLKKLGYQDFEVSHPDFSEISRGKMPAIEKIMVIIGQSHCLEHGTCVNYLLLGGSTFKSEAWITAIC